MEKTNSKREIQFDIIRVVALLMMLGVHIVNATNYKSYTGAIKCIMQTLNDVFLICNPLFFMLAGKFNLKYKFENKEDYKSFYFKKFVTIFIPFFVVSLIQYILLYWGNLNILDFIIKFGTNEIFFTNWFIYAYLGLIIFTPFLSKIVNNLNEFEKKLLLLICFFANLIVISFDLFGFNSGISFQFLGLAFWHIFYLAGYIIDDVIKTKKEKNIIIALGLLATISQALIRNFGPAYRYITDPNPLTILQGFGVYVFIKEYIFVKNNTEQKIIFYLAKNSYTFYLCHGIIINFAVGLLNQIKLNFSSLLFVIEVGLYILVFIIALISSIVLNKLIFNPIKKKLLYKGKETNKIDVTTSKGD